MPAMMPYPSTWMYMLTALRYKVDEQVCVAVYGHLEYIPDAPPESKSSVSSTSNGMIEGPAKCGSAQRHRGRVGNR